MKNILEKLYYNYFHLDKQDLYFDLDKDFFRFLFFLTKSDNVTSLEFALSKFKEVKNKNFINNMIAGKMNEDVPDAEKEFVNIRIPLTCSLEKLNLIDNIISVEDSINIFGITIDEIKTILNAIFIRVLIYNETQINEEKAKNYKELCDNELSCFFNSEDISKLIPDIKKESIKTFLNFFTVDFDEINEIKDVYKIIEIDNVYVIYSIHDLFSNFFAILEEDVINYYKEKRIDPEAYRKKRGEEFEKIVYNFTDNYFSNNKTHLNRYYLFENKKQELDVLQYLNNVIIYIECKSASFDLYEIENDKELFEKMISAFGRGYESVDTFHKYCSSDNHKKKFYKSQNDFIDANTHDKKIVSIILSLNDIEYISGNVQLLKNKSFEKPDYYPITLNFSDYLALIIFTKKNKSKDMFIEYLIKRHEIINGHVKYGLGPDEIDAFGMLSDNREKHNINRFINASSFNTENTTGEIHFNVGNGYYRESVNSDLDSLYLLFAIETFFRSNVSKQVKKIFDMDEGIQMD
jgi:hypothetical protein